jgi:hypothetical protein
MKDGILVVGGGRRVAKGDCGGGCRSRAPLDKGERRVAERQEIASERR